MKVFSIPSKDSDKTNVKSIAVRQWLYTWSIGYFNALQVVYYSSFKKRVKSTKPSYVNSSTHLQCY